MVRFLLRTLEDWRLTMSNLCNLQLRARMGLGAMLSFLVCACVTQDDNVKASGDAMCASIRAQPSTDPSIPSSAAIAKSLGIPAEEQWAALSPANQILAARIIAAFLPPDIQTASYWFDINYLHTLKREGERIYKLSYSFTQPGLGKIFVPVTARTSAELRPLFEEAIQFLRRDDCPDGLVIYPGNGLSTLPWEIVHVLTDVDNKSIPESYIFDVIKSEELVSMHTTLVGSSSTIGLQPTFKNANLPVPFARHLWTLSKLAEKKRTHYIEFQFGIRDASGAINVPGQDTAMLVINTYGPLLSIDAVMPETTPSDLVATNLLQHLLLLVKGGVLLTTYHIPEAYWTWLLTNVANMYGLKYEITNTTWGTRVQRTS